MKKLKLFMCVALFGAMGFGAFSAYNHLTMSEEERFLLTNIEALTDPEGETGGWTYCRCHNDGKCYVGNAISFRPSCVRLAGNASGNDCQRYASNCPPAV